MELFACPLDQQDESSLGLSEEAFLLMSIISIVEIEEFDLGQAVNCFDLFLSKQ
jgi:hypothetical protein